MVSRSLKRRLNCAVTLRSLGVPYQDALARFEITSSEFYRYVTERLHLVLNQANLPVFWKDIKVLPEFGGGISQRAKLENIISTENKRLELFDMSEDFLKQQYDDVLNIRKKDKTRSQFLQGTLMSQSNRQFIAYHALTSKHAGLGSNNRDEVYYGIIGNSKLRIKGLPYKLYSHFVELGLKGMMYGYPYEGKLNSPMTVLNLFDLEFQRRTSNPSLYDLRERNHLHRSGDRFFVQANLNDFCHAKEEAYHFLTVHNGEYNEALASMIRAEVLYGLSKMQFPLDEHFRKIGLGKLMRHRSVEKALRLFDHRHIEKSGNESLFKKSIFGYAEFDNRNRLVVHLP